MQIEKTYGQLVAEAAHMVAERGADRDAMVHMIAFACGFTEESVDRDMDEMISAVQTGAL